MSIASVRTEAVDEPSIARRNAPPMLAVAEVRWALAALLLFALGGALQLSTAPAWTWWMAYLLCYAAGGWEPGLAGLQALRDKTLDVDLLMVVAAIVAASIGQVLDGALLIVIFATSGALEAAATKRTRDSITSLLDLAPQLATRLDDNGAETEVAAADLAVGDRLLVRPGERIAADGQVIDGSSDVDQASITGEPLPALKQVGAEVFAGTLNGTGALVVRVSRPAAESVVARIVVMVEQASATKATTQLFVEKIEQRYSIGMVAATLALFAVPLAFGQALQPSLLRAITFMIVASPCAVVLATMPPLLSAIANAGRHGVLVKSAVVMEQLAITDLVAFDKTGTLTEGRPELTGIELLGGTPWTSAEVLRWAAAAERSSEHPLGVAVVGAARGRGIAVPDASAFSSAPGRGVTAVVEGRTIRVGSPAVLAGDETAAHTLVRASEGGGCTAVVVLVDDTVAAVLSLSDRIRIDAAATVADLWAATGNRPVLLTGDNEAAARSLASAVGISDLHAQLLPEGKVDVVRQLQTDGHRVLLVGDGVNDAPAMATAALGVAMGRSGSDLALDTADAVIVRDELTVLPKIVALSRRARRVVVANLAIAATVITALVLWDVFATLPLPLGVAGHEGSTVVVGLNGLRLLRSRAWGRSS